MDPVNICEKTTNLMSCCEYMILYDGVEALCLSSAQYQHSSGHYIGNASVLDRSSQIMEPMAVAAQPRMKTHYNICVFLLLIHNPQGWCRSFMSTDKYKSTSGHHIRNSSFLDPSSQITEPTPVFHPSTTAFYTLYYL
jgi:hypothetical protein